MSDGRLEAIRERWSKATPGPWRVGMPSFRCTMPHRPHGEGTCDYRFEKWVDGGEIYRDNLAADARSGDETLVAGMWDYQDGGVKESTDAEAIAAAPADIAYLLTLADDLMARIATLEAEQGKIKQGE